ncbi:hypothetical protein LzC2_21940 [Planctomycetes bacterium LzC2]|uniref:DUF1501 domain-containing protein n=2 Tax=Alienimonas chondri TaxID=2681879 RepID=A0ABX1VDI3_9PLAN|nr:hypothetical protein [Alienimonas chondri]
MNTVMFDSHAPLSRRQMLVQAGTGLGVVGLAATLAQDGRLLANETDGESAVLGALPHHPPRAKAVIHLFMNGGLSHVDSFDPKPQLTKYDGKALPIELKTERPTGAAFASQYEFKQYGESGLPISEMFSHVGAHADDLCILRGMHADVPNHEPSLLLMNTGDGRLARPSYGSWLTYGLGSENRNLPGYIVLCPNGYPTTGAANWRSAFLPGVHAGTHVDPRHKEVDKLVEHVRPRLSPKAQREQLELLRAMNAEHAARAAAQAAEDAKLEARIQSFETAYRMQDAAAEAFDLSKEPKEVRELYGLDEDPTRLHGRMCLLARRLVERGVRCVQLYHGQGQPWDHHDDIVPRHLELAKQCDKPHAALLTDLKRLGLLDETLVMCGGEFGRTPVVEMPKEGSNQGKVNGRDHNHHGFSVWMAGGGVKGGHVHGATDEFGFAAVEGRTHVHDLHATMLHLMGVDHERLTYRHAGRDFRLTDVHGRVVSEILA